MRRNSYALAALAVAAVPDLRPVRTAPFATPMEDLDVALVESADGRTVLVTSPAAAAAGAHLEQDVHVTETLSGTMLAPLVSAPIGFARLPEGGRAVVAEPPTGGPLMFDYLIGGELLARSLGATIARIHAIPEYVAESAGVEAYSAEALRAAHAAQVQRARDARELPASVDQRFGQLLADDGLWDFTPTFVHGGLSEECLRTDGEAITAVTDWHEARVGDPATDLAWLVSALDPETFDLLYDAYGRESPVAAHPRLIERAQALGEFAVLEWLLHGLDTGDETITADGRAMLADLDHDLAQIAREEAEAAYDHLAGEREQTRLHEDRSEDDEHGRHGAGATGSARRDAELTETAQMNLARLRARRAAAESVDLEAVDFESAEVESPEVDAVGDEDLDHVESEHADEDRSDRRHGSHPQPGHHHDAAGSHLAGLGEAESLDAQRRSFPRPSTES